MMRSFPSGGCAVVLGASGAIGAAVLAQLRDDSPFATVHGFSRHSQPALELTDEASIAAIAADLKAIALPVRLVFDATGLLHAEGMMPEKRLRDIDPVQFQRQFEINTLGPVLLMKHLLPMLPREGKSVFATLSARVGSIADNQLGGWHSYRASKAALNMYVRNTSIELARAHPQAICLAMHPGTVESRLSEPFAKRGLNVRPPAEAATDLLRVIDGLSPEHTGQLIDYRGEVIPY